MPKTLFIVVVPETWVGNLQHAYTWNTKQFLMGCRSSMLFMSILLWFTQKEYWPWLVY